MAEPQPKFCPFCGSDQVTVRATSLLMCRSCRVTYLIGYWRQMRKSAKRKTND